MKKYALHIPADLCLSAAVRAVAAYIFAEIGFPEAEVARLKLVFDEILMNAVKYGSKAGSSVHITFVFENNLLQVTFEDEGGIQKISAAELQKIISAQRLNTNPAKKSGRGLAQIAGEWADELHVREGGQGGLCVSFSKSLSGAAESSEEISATSAAAPKPLVSKKLAAATLRLPHEILYLAGEIDNANASDSVNKIEMYLQKKQNAFLLVLDMKNLLFLNSSFIARIVAWNRQLENRGGALALQNVNPAIREVFELVGIPKLVAISAQEILPADDSLKNNN